MNRWRERRRMQVQRVLETAESPRILFFFMLSWSIVIGFLASLTLRHLGIAHMGARYVLATAIAYGVFLLFLWLWLRFRSDPVDGPDMSWFDPGSGHDTGSCSSGTSVLRPGGGQSGGAGASGDIDHSVATEALVSAKTESAGGVTEVAASAGEGLGLVWLIGVMLFAVLAWVVSTAPVLLAEIVLESFLLGALYRRWRRSDEPYRLQAAWRQTRIPFLVVLAITGALGTLLQWHAPHADTLGAVWQQAK